MARYDVLPPKPLPRFDREADRLQRAKRTEDRSLMETHGPIAPKRQLRRADTDRRVTRSR